MSSLFLHTRVVFELVFPTQEQLPPSIIVGTRGKLNSQLWNVAAKPRKTNLENDAFGRVTGVHEAHQLDGF